MVTGLVFLQQVHVVGGLLGGIEFWWLRTPLFGLIGVCMFLFELYLRGRTDSNLEIDANRNRASDTSGLNPR